jgi:hypothetical protein
MLRSVPHLLLFWGIAALTGCYHNPYVDPASNTSPTYRPVYTTLEATRNIQTMGPQPLKNPGRIYVKDNYLFINEIGSGIHIVDNRNPAKPLRIAFVSIPGNRELAVKDSILYADNAPDLIALNIANPLNVRVVKRIEKAFPSPYTNYPNQYGVRFECPDPSKGVVLRWEQAPVANPQCYR